MRQSFRVLILLSLLCAACAPAYQERQIVPADDPDGSALAAIPTNAPVRWWLDDGSTGHGYFIALENDTLVVAARSATLRQPPEGLQRLPLATVTALRAGQSELEGRARSGAAGAVIVAAAAFAAVLIWLATDPPLWGG
ncbi:MAG: hypothetical protein R3C71_10140 [Candidatus Krumholzibacteriia bacterium]|nr:hypothetical protein [Candidatus Latescibacterota bacterium]